MAYRASGRKARGFVVGVRRGVEVGEVTRHAGRIEPRILSTGMAVRAVERDVRARQGKERLRMVELRTQPLKRRMADGAVLRETGRDMIRISGFLKVGQMARIAILGRAQVFPADVTTAATRGNVRAGQRECSEVVVEGRGDPGRGRVTDGTRLRQAGRPVIGVGGAVVIVEMAGDATGVEAYIFPADVTRRAGHRDVRAG